MKPPWLDCQGNVFGEVDVNLSLRKGQVLENLKAEWKIKIPGLFGSNWRTSLSEGDTFIGGKWKEGRRGPKDPYWGVNL